MSENQITVNTRPVADQYGSEKIIEFSSPVGGGLISFLITPDDQLSVHVARQDMTVRVTAGEAGTPVRHGNLRADAALYQAARAFVTDWEAAHPDQDAGAVSRLTALARDLGVSEPDLDDYVHDLASNPASDINNGGLADQVGYLAAQAGAAEAERMIREAARAGRPPV